MLKLKKDREDQVLRGLPNSLDSYRGMVEQINLLTHILEILDEAASGVEEDED